LINWLFRGVVIVFLIYVARTFNKSGEPQNEIAASETNASGGGGTEL
jgi:hypothetical protein